MKQLVTKFRLNHQKFPMASRAITDVHNFPEGVIYMNLTKMMPIPII